MKSAEMSNGTEAVRTPCSFDDSISSAGKARLAEEDPDRRHRGRARTQMKGKRHVSMAVAEGALHAAHGGLVDLPELGRAAERLVHDLDARLRSCPKPLQVRRDDPFVVVGQEEDLVERAGVERLRDGPDAHRRTLGGRSEVGSAHPGDEDLSHRSAYTRYLTVDTRHLTRSYLA